MPLQASARSSLLTRVSRAFGFVSGIASRAAVATSSAPRFKISSFAFAYRKGRGAHARLVILNTGGDCFDVGVIVGATRVAEFASIKHGRFKRLTIVFPTQERLPNVKVIGFDANGSPCERTFRRDGEVDGSATFS